MPVPVLSLCYVCLCKRGRGEAGCVLAGLFHAYLAPGGVAGLTSANTESHTTLSINWLPFYWHIHRTTQQWLFLAECRNQLNYHANLPRTTHLEQGELNCFGGNFNTFCPIFLNLPPPFFCFFKGKSIWLINNSWYESIFSFCKSRKCLLLVGI